MKSDLIPVRIGNGDQNVGAIEVRWAEDGDPDDVVAPWPSSLGHRRIGVHIERMSDGTIWAQIEDRDSNEFVTMWFTAERKGVLSWRASSEG